MHKSTYQGVSKGIEISKYFFQNYIKLFYKIINLQLIYFKYVTSYENDIWTFQLLSLCPHYNIVNVVLCNANWNAINY